MTRQQSIAPKGKTGISDSPMRGITRKARVKNRWKYIFTSMSTEEIVAYIKANQTILADHVEKKNFLRSIPVHQRIRAQQQRLNALHGEIGRINGALSWLKKHKPKAYEMAK